MSEVSDRPAAAWAWRLAFGALAPTGARSRLSILIFHRVTREPDPLQPGEPSADEFLRQMRWVREWFNVLPLSQAVQKLKAGTLPARALAITFDDGYADNHDVALPVLRALGLPATFFIATGYLDGGRMFNDTLIEAVRRAPGSQLDLTELGLGVHAVGDDGARRASIRVLLERVKYLPQSEREATVFQVAERCAAHLPDDLMMRSEQVAALQAAGMEIGAHTVTHPILEEVTLSTARREIAEGRERLQQITGQRIGLFAYPNGRPGRDYSTDHVSLVRELGFDAAVSTAWGAAATGVDEYQLPRFTPWDRNEWRYGLRMARTLARRHYALA